MISSQSEHGDSRFISGNAEADAERLGRGGWFIGTFFSDDPTATGRTSDDLEVKYWTFPRGGGQSHHLKSSSTIEWSFILRGKVRADIGGDRLELGAGDYALIHPGVPNNIVFEVLEDTVGITVKSPSDPMAKTIVSD